MNSPGKNIGPDLDQFGKDSFALPSLSVAVIGIVALFDESVPEVKRYAAPSDGRIHHTGSTDDAYHLNRGGRVKN